MEDILKLQYLSDQLDLSVRSLRKTGQEYYKAEYEYQVEKAQTALRLKDEGMPATMINLIIKGIPSVATKRFDRDCKRVLYEANQESINSIKIQMRMMDSQIQRDWGQSK